MTVAMATKYGIDNIHLSLLKMFGTRARDSFNNTTAFQQTIRQENVESSRKDICKILPTDCHPVKY